MNLDDQCVCVCACVCGRRGRKKAGRRDELLDGEKHGLYVEIHDLVPPVLLVYFFKLAPPRRPRVRKQNINPIRVLPHLGHQPLDFAQLRAVGWNADRLGPWGFVWKRVERCDGFGACTGFAACDEDFGAPGL